MLIERLYYGINETKQRELELLISCLYNNSANLYLQIYNTVVSKET